jgi:hypothetical protein
VKRTLAASILAIALVASPLVAHADEPDVHPAVAYALNAQPGGVATSYYSAEWPKLDMTLDVAWASTFAVGTCATGTICAYSEGAMAGVKLSWTTCGSKSTAALSTVGSIANARTSGTLTARQSTTVRATAAANSYANVPLSYRSLITSVYC